MVVPDIMGRRIQATGTLILIREDFARVGTEEAQIPEVVKKAVSSGRVIEYQGHGNGRPIFEVHIDGRSKRIAVTVSANGFIVGANPAGSSN